MLLKVGRDKICLLTGKDIWCLIVSGDKSNLKNCTDKLQTMDFFFNKLAHYFQKSEFSQFYAAEVVKQSESKGKILALEFTFLLSV